MQLKLSSQQAQVLLLRRCQTLQELKRVHSDLQDSGLDRSTFVGNVVIQMYGQLDSVENSRAAFEKISRRNVFSWNIVISAYARNGHMVGAEAILQKMPFWCLLPWTAMIKAYSQAGNVDLASHIFGRMPHRDLVSWTAVVSAYALNGYLGEFVSFFQKMPCWDVVCCAAALAGFALSSEPLAAKGMFDAMPWRSMECWNSMITAFSNAGQLQVAKIVFEKIPQRSLVTWAVMVHKCLQFGHISEARMMFQSMPEENVSLLNCMITAYAELGDMREAKLIFDKAVDKNLVSWTSLITGYAHIGQGREALRLFYEMDLEGIQPDAVTYVSVLDACTSLTALGEGKAIFSEISESRLASNTGIITSLISLYGICGNVEEARSTFNGMEIKDVVSWTTMVVAYAHNGYSREALEIFQHMNSEGILPVWITFISIIAACSHAGLVTEGAKFFMAMKTDYNIYPSLEHYRCLLDLLGRAGHLMEAEDLLNTMPFEPDIAAWRTLLSCSKLHGDAARARIAAKFGIQLDPDTLDLYVLLANVYAEDDGRFILRCLPAPP